MSLRSRLSAAFALLALLPTGLLGWAALRSVNTSFGAISETQLKRAEQAGKAELEAQQRLLSATLQGLMREGTPLRNAARQLSQGSADLPSMVSLASALRPAAPYALLSLLDAQGRVLSSAHLPGSFGVEAADLRALAETGSAETPARTLGLVELRQEGQIITVLAFLVAAPVPTLRGAGPSLYAILGRPVDAALAVSLRRATGASVRLIQPSEGKLLGSALLPQPPASPFPWSTRLAGRGEPTPQRTLHLGQAGDPQSLDVQLRVSLAPLLEARVRILGIVLFAGGFGLLIALLLGWVLARRMTRPLARLAEAAQALGRGDESLVLESGPAEIGVLVRSFEQMRDELKRSHQRIAAAERIAAWQEIARRLAHEIKNPLTPISTAIETLRRAHDRSHPAFEEIFGESTTAIQEEVVALRGIVDSFARFARLPAPAPEQTTVQALLDQATALFPEAPAGVAFSQAVEPGLPELNVDRGQLQQLLLNLVTNALQSHENTPTHTLSGKLQLGARREGAGVVIWVADNGPGIAESDREKIFTPYFTTKAQGTGLGLAICHRIASEHGGSLSLAPPERLDPAEGLSTCFELYLPAAEQPGPH